MYRLQLLSNKITKVPVKTRNAVDRLHAEQYSIAEIETSALLLQQQQQPLCEYRVVQEISHHQLIY